MEEGLGDVEVKAKDLVSRETCIHAAMGPPQKMISKFCIIINATPNCQGEEEEDHQEKQREKSTEGGTKMRFGPTTREANVGLNR